MLILVSTLLGTERTVLGFPTHTYFKLSKRVSLHQTTAKALTTMDSTNEIVDLRTPVFVSETLQTFDKVNVSRKARCLVGQASGIIGMGRQSAIPSELSYFGCRFRTMPQHSYQPSLTPYHRITPCFYLYSNLSAHLSSRI
jgi:hypothetical protein